MIFYIEKLDITEEKVRLDKHCDYFRQVAAEEFGYAPQFDKTVVNDDLEKAVAEVESIVKEFIA